MDSSSSEYNTARATAIVAILTTLTKDNLSPACSSSDVSELTSAKDAAKAKADEVVTTQTNLISKKTDELNDLVSEINSLNQQIAAAGGTTKDPGTTAQTVPTVAGPTSGPTGSSSAGPTGSSSAGPTSAGPTGSTSAGPTSAGPTGSTSA